MFDIKFIKRFCGTITITHEWILIKSMDGIQLARHDPFFVARAKLFCAIRG
jgi:hypothetical protein